MLKTCLRTHWNGCGKGGCQFRAKTYLVRLNSAAKMLTIKTIYVIRKKKYFFSITYGATLRSNTELLPRVTSPGDTFDRHQIHGKKNIVLVPQVLEGLALSMWCLVLPFIPIDRSLKSHWVLKQRSRWGFIFTCEHHLKNLSVQLKHWM